MRNTIEEAARVEREKIHYDLKQAYKIHKDILHYATAAACIDKYAVDLFKAGSDFALTHQWRNVDDEQPKQCETVLCVNANADPHCKWCWLSFYVGDIFQDNADSKATFPTHWLRIPELPSPNPELKTTQR